MRKKLVACAPAHCLVVIVLGLSVLGLSGCGGDDGQSGSAAAASADPGSGLSSALSISGNPGSTAVVGTPYTFTPAANADAATKLTYLISNKPAWASFDTTTGHLYGTPSSAAVGTTSNIVIAATDGVTNATLTAFSITVTDVTNGTATVSWALPTTNSDGTPLTNLAGFHIYYGTSADSLNQMMDVTNSSVSTYVLTNLGPATWYFGVKAYTTSGAESSISNIASKTIS